MKIEFSKLELLLIKNNPLKLATIVTKELATRIGYFDSKINPFLNRKENFQIEKVKELIKNLYIIGLPKLAFECICLQLDYLFPDWKKCVDERIIGLSIHRNSTEVLNWRHKVLFRDNNECQICDSKINLHAHHILSWASYPASRIDISNGITLCDKCHHSQHPELGIGMFIKNICTNGQ